MNCFILPYLKVTWDYERYHLAGHTHRTMLVGYESMVGEIKTVMMDISYPAYKEVKKSCLGNYLYLEKYNTRNGTMLHYVVFRQVTPNPNPDTTALWFKIGDVILRFSREEFALVTGLRFGQSNFNPYKSHQVPEESVFARLFRCNEKTTTKDVFEMFKNKKFTYFEGEGLEKKEIEVKATVDDYIKIAKLLIATTYIVGFEQSTKIIPIWLWVLLEDKQQWEDFPWGSYSYQALTHQIRNVKKDRVPNSGKVSYHIKGNTIAFSVS